MYLFFNLIYVGICISIPIIIVLLLKNKLLKRYSCKFNSFLCGLIFFRMIFLIKFKIEMTFNNFSFNIIPSEHSDIAQFLRKQIYLNENIYLLFKIAMFVWLVVFAFLVIKMIMYNSNLYKYLYRYSEEVHDEKIFKILNKNKEHLKIKKEIKMYSIKNLNSALLTTFGENKIFLPDVEYNEEELNLVIKHELIHLKRKDNLKKLFINILTCIYWFNPLVKKLNLYFEELCELANDEEITSEASNKEKKEYASLLLKTRNEQLKTYTLYLNGSFFARGKKSDLRGRIEEVLNKILKKEYYIIIPVLAILFFSSICSLNYKNFKSKDTYFFKKENVYYLQDNYTKGYGSFNKNKYGQTYGNFTQLQGGQKIYPDLIEVVFDEDKQKYIISQENINNNYYEFDSSSSEEANKGYIKKDDYLKISKQDLNYDYYEMVQNKTKVIDVYDKDTEKVIGQYSNI